MNTVVIIYIYHDLETERLLNYMSVWFISTWMHTYGLAITLFIIHASSMHHPCIIHVLSLLYPCIIRTSSIHHLYIICTSSVNHSYIIHTSSIHPYECISNSLFVHHPWAKHALAIHHPFIINYQWFIHANLMEWWWWWFSPLKKISWIVESY